MPIKTLAQTTIKGWNSVVQTELDFYRLCDVHDIMYRETDLIPSAGEYLVYRDTQIILVNSFAADSYKLWIQFHEFGHFLLHAPGSFSASWIRRMDFEANVIAACALIPMTLLETTAPADILDLYRYPRQLLECRLNVFDRLKI